MNKTLVAAFIALSLIAVVVYSLMTNGPDKAVPTASTPTTDVKKTTHSGSLRLAGQFVQQLCVQDGPGCNDVSFVQDSGKLWRLLEETDEIRSLSSDNGAVTIEAQIIDTGTLRVIEVNRVK